MWDTDHAQRRQQTGALYMGVGEKRTLIKGKIPSEAKLKVGRVPTGRTIAERAEEGGKKQKLRVLRNGGLPGGHTVTHMLRHALHALVNQNAQA